MADKKVDSARALVAGGWLISLVSRCLRVSRAQLHAMARQSKDWQDRRCKRKPDNTEALARIHTVIGDLPTYGYRRVWALLRRQSETDYMAVVTASCVRMRRCLSVNRQYRHRIGRIQRKWPSEKVTSGGALTVSGSAVIAVKNCGSRSYCSGRPVPADMTVKPCRASYWVQRSVASVTA